MGDNEELPSIKQAIEQWLGIQLPAIPMPQTLKNIDKALAKVVLASGENLEARIRQNTGRAKARGKVEIEGMYRTLDEKRKLENRIAATKAAFEELEADPGLTDAPSEIEDDWLNLFARLSEDKSSEELQRLFGKILSGEVRRPGSFSLRTIAVMATMSKTDTDAVSKFLSYSLHKMIVPFAEGGPSDNDRLLMEELGIAGHPSSIGGMAIHNSVEPNDKVFFLALGAGILIENKTTEPIPFQVSGQTLTNSARELIPIAGSAPTDLEFLKKVAVDVHSEIRKYHGAGVNAGLILVHAVTATHIESKTFKYNVVFTVPYT